MSTVIATVKLHTNQREQSLLVPLYITGTVAVISVLISLVFWRSGSIPGTDEWIQGSQFNPGIGYALVGFLVYAGVAAVATTFPFALSLGTSRRAFTAGTLLWQALTAAYIALILLVLLGVELATDHWFFGFYIFDIFLLGAGDPLRLLAIVFLGVLTSLSVGGVFAAASGAVRRPRPAVHRRGPGPRDPGGGARGYPELCRPSRLLSNCGGSPPSPAASSCSPRLAPGCCCAGRSCGKHCPQRRGQAPGRGVAVGDPSGVG